jgi:glycosyltransferase involved in cell wall biosynthesis
VGRASVAVEALYSLTNELADFKIVFYSCNAKTIRLVKKLKRKTGLNVEWHGKGDLSHTQMLDLFASARIYIGVSLSDGISTSLLEAMAMGAFPIQTSTACVDDWIDNGVTGSSLSAIDPRVIADTLRGSLALGVASLGDGIATNRETVRSKANIVRSLINAKAFYA